MKALVLAAALVAPSVASAQSFSTFDFNGNFTYGNVYPGGGFVADNYGRMTLWNGPVQTVIYQPRYQPLYRPYYYQPPVYRRPWRGW